MSSSCAVYISAYRAVVDPGGNAAPVVDAGAASATVYLDEALVLRGTASDDTTPAPSLVATWSQASGPGTALFAAPNALETTVQFSAPGTYVVQLSVSDGQRSGADSISVTVAADTAAPAVPLQLDASRGRNVSIPYAIQFTPNELAGGLFNTGMTGVDTNGSDSLSTLFERETVSVDRSAGGVLLFAEPSPAPASLPSFAPHFGIDMDDSTPEFHVRARILNPFDSLATSDQVRRIGISIGNGVQQNNVQIYANLRTVDFPNINVRFNNGAGSQVGYDRSPGIVNSEWLDLFLVITMPNFNVRAGYQIRRDGVTGSLEIPAPFVSPPHSWYQGTNGLVVSLIVPTLTGAGFPARFDLVEVVSGPAVGH